MQHESVLLGCNLLLLFCIIILVETPVIVLPTGPGSCFALLGVAKAIITSIKQRLLFLRLRMGSNRFAESLLLLLRLRMGSNRCAERLLLLRLRSRLHCWRCCCKGWGWGLLLDDRGCRQVSEPCWSARPHFLFLRLLLLYFLLYFLHFLHLFLLFVLLLLYSVPCHAVPASHLHLFIHTIGLRLLSAICLHFPFCLHLLDLADEVYQRHTLIVAVF
mmetsp:Transcript_1936/g.2995  ORF Transcript_1936/g.2995 Transcript_1936/m.2995 type:complete len:217 (-) Transcript_1936:2579-3229(-)